MNAPLRVEITRGDAVESVHDVDAVVVDASGSVVSFWGDAERGVMPRSAIKPIQAIPLVESGAADAFDLSAMEMALSCASHNAEPAHVEAVTAWLDRIGLDVSAFECGSHYPSYDPASKALVAAGIKPDARYNNCSGKHTGFLTVCQHLGLEPAGYINPTHPLHADHITPAIESFCEVSLSGQVPGTDGCGIPVWTVPLRSLAHGWAKLADHPLGRRLVESMMAEPFYVAGSERTSTEIMAQASRATAAKGGAEGVFCALVVHEGLGVAVKARDGAHRASGAAVRHLLDRLGVVTAGPESLTNWAGTQVGEIRVAADA